MAYIKINKENYFHNLNQLALKTGSKDKLAVVLKDNAYGHGIEVIAKLAFEWGVKSAVVMSQDEALKIKDYFKDILILNDTPQNIDNFSFAISSIDRLKEVNPKAKIELKVDTGMHRNGISLSQLKEAISIIKQRDINLFGVMTHFGRADELDSGYYWQKKRFDEVKRAFREARFKNIRFHSNNSAGVLRSSSFDEDIARVGIATYGYSCLPKIFGEFNLKPVMSLWAKRVSTRELKRGQRVGYGGDFIASRDMVISTYDLGYGDGWFRGDSNKPYILPSGLKILGRVSMDFISLESNKEELCIMDNAQESAEHFNTISYEILASLKKSIKREIV